MGAGGVGGSARRGKNARQRAPQCSTVGLIEANVALIRCRRSVRRVPVGEGTYSKAEGTTVQLAKVP